MFLKKNLCFKNLAVNCRRIESLYKSVRTVPSVINIKSFSSNCQSVQIDVTLVNTIKKGTKTPTYEVKSLPGSKVCVGKAPFFNQTNNSLYYADLNAGKLLRYDIENKIVNTCQINGAENASFIIPLDGQENQFIVGNKRNIELVIWDGVDEKCSISKTFDIVQCGEEFLKNRFNVGKVDAQGRLFAGTMANIENPFEAKLGELFMFDGNETKTVVCNMGMPSGLAWNKDETKLYVVDGAEYNIKEYQFCKKDGNASEPRIVYTWNKSKVPQHLLVPSGLTIDVDDNLYVCTNGGTIYKINPCKGQIVMAIIVPVGCVTDVAFGGCSMDTLYVTTCSRSDDTALAGSVFTVTGLGAKGLPMNSFKHSKNC